MYKHNSFSFVAILGTLGLPMASALETSYDLFNQVYFSQEVPMTFHQGLY